MSTEGLDCWDDYPMEHGCICGNDCAPRATVEFMGQPAMNPKFNHAASAPRALDPLPWLNTSTQRVQRKAQGDRYDDMFKPREGYSQDRKDYA